MNEAEKGCGALNRQVVVANSFEILGTGTGTATGIATKASGKKRRCNTGNIVHGTDLSTQAPTSEETTKKKQDKAPRAKKSVKFDLVPHILMLTRAPRRRSEKLPSGDDRIPRLEPTLLLLIRSSKQATPSMELEQKLEAPRPAKKQSESRNMDRISP